MKPYMHEKEEVRRVTASRRRAVRPPDRELRRHAGSPGRNQTSAWPVCVGQYSEERGPAKSRCNDSGPRGKGDLHVSRIRSSLGSLVLLSSISSIPAQAQQVLISELCPRPVSGAAAWIELRNVGQDYTPLSGYALRNEKGDRCVLPESTPPLAAGACLGVLFDGQDRIDGNILHSSAAGFLTKKAGAISLIGPTGVVVDSAGWGRGQPYEIKPAVGGRIATLPSGASIGRSAAAAAFDTIGWAVYEPSATTIGIPNPPALIRDTHPLSGAIIEKQGTILSWFPMPGAIQYNVQLSSDPSFATLLAEKTVKLAPRDPDWHWLCFEDETMPCTCGWTSWTVPCDAKWDKSGKAHDEHIETYKFTDGYIIWSHYEWDLKKPVN